MNQHRLDQILQMLAKNPNDSFLNYAAALEFKKNQKPEVAIDILEKLIKRDENYLPAYFQLGKLYELILNRQMALQIYSKGKEIAVRQHDVKTLAEIENALSLAQQ